MKDTINKVQFSLFSLLSILVLKRLKSKDYVTLTFTYGFLELRGLCIKLSKRLWTNGADKGKWLSISSKSLYILDNLKLAISYQ